MLGETKLNGQLMTVDAIKKFLFAGNATITLVSRKTGKRFTYKVKQAINDDTKEKKDFWFVSLLCGPDNETAYRYLGHISGALNFIHGKKSPFTKYSEGLIAWRWFYNEIVVKGLDYKLLQIEVWHEGRCGRCNRKLTVPDSIEHGFGPECIQHV